MKAFRLTLHFAAFWLAVFHALIGVSAASNARPLLWIPEGSRPSIRPGVLASDPFPEEFGIMLGGDMQGNGLAKNLAMAASNDAAFDGSHLSQPLTDYVTRLMDDTGIEDELEAVAPSVPVARSFDWLKADLLEDFQIDRDGTDVREIGGEFKELRPKGVQVHGRTENKGLFMRIDKDMGGNDENVRQNAVRLLTDRLMRNDLYRIMTALAGGATATSTASVNWGATNTAVDPDGNMAQLLLEAGNNRGTEGNRLLMSRTAFTERFIALGRPANGNPALTATRTLSAQQLGDVLGVDKLIVSKRRYQDSVTYNSTAQSKKQVLDGAAGATVLLAFLSEENISTMDGSNVKRFRTACEGGGMVRVWVNDAPMKYVVIGVEHYSTIILTNNYGLFKTTVTYT